jgi:hypothetical protein
MVEPEVEAAGIEPAVPSAPKTPGAGVFEHWKLDGGVNPQEANRPASSGPGDRLPAPPSRNFSFKTTICGIDFEVIRESKGLNLHLYCEGELWLFAPITPVLLDQLQALVKAAELAYEAQPHDV